MLNVAMPRYLLLLTVVSGQMNRRGEPVQLPTAEKGTNATLTVSNEESKAASTGQCVLSVTNTFVASSAHPVIWQGCLEGPDQALAQSVLRFKRQITFAHEDEGLSAVQLGQANSKRAG
jgi:hypothetical protein